MQITRFNEAKPYDVPAHFGTAGLRLQGEDANPDAFCTIGLSYYLPGGRAEMSAGAAPKIYVVVDGELTIELEDGARSVLGPFDSCLILGGERRAVRNETNSVASMLVILPA